MCGKYTIRKTQKTWKTNKKDYGNMDIDVKIINKSLVS